MKKVVLQFFALSTFVLPALCAQGITVRAARSPSRATDREAAAARSTPRGSAPMSLVQRSDLVFPHVAAGGGWETVMVLVNIGTNEIDFNQYFYNDTGNPMQVKFHTIPEDQIVETTAIEGHLPPGSSVKVTLFEDTPSAQVGWAQLEYDSVLNRIGGYACFRLASGGVVNEGMVPLSAYDDTSFMMPFDNSDGVSTGIAFANPATGVSNQVQIVALDENGDEITRDSVSIPPNGHLSYVLTGRLPALAGQRGTLAVTSNITRLSAAGIRMNVSGGLTFTSIPIMRWIPGT
jgi:hypothetical protein